MAKDDVVRKENIAELNSNFIYDLDRSLSKDCYFVDKDNGVRDITIKLGKVDSYYWDIDSRRSKSTIDEKIIFNFKINPTTKRKLKKSRILKNLLIFIGFKTLITMQNN